MKQSKGFWRNKPKENAKDVIFKKRRKHLRRNFFRKCGRSKPVKKK
jgi:hypothetical protein